MTVREILFIVIGIDVAELPARAALVFSKPEITLSRQTDAGLTTSYGEKSDRGSFDAAAG